MRCPVRNQDSLLNKRPLVPQEDLAVAFGKLPEPFEASLGFQLVQPEPIEAGTANLTWL